MVQPFEQPEHKVEPVDAVLSLTPAQCSWTGSQENSHLGFSPAIPVSLLLADKRIYRLPVFTEEFCQAFVDELENFEQSDMPKGRPNTMNNYGVGLVSCASLGGVFTVFTSSLLPPSSSNVLSFYTVQFEFPVPWQ